MLALLVFAAPVVSPAQPALFVQDDLADLQPGKVTGAEWISVPRAEVSARFCAAAASVLVLTSHALNRHERDHCTAVGHGNLVEMLIGRRAVLAMTLGASFGLTPELMYRALARDVSDASGRFVPNPAKRWRDLDLALPDSPIRVLLPRAGSIEDRLVDEAFLYEGCASAAMSRLPRSASRRFSLCTTLRTDAAVTRAAVDQPVVEWLRLQGGTGVALIGVATLLAEPALDTALPFDGVGPSFATIADGSYHAALPVWLLSIIAPGSGRTVATVTDPLLAESALGPLGKLPQRGLAPLAAADRVKLRATIAEAVENAIN